MTSEDGRFLLSISEQFPVSLTAAAPGYLPNTTEVKEAALPLDVSLAPAQGRLSILAVTDWGEAVAGAFFFFPDLARGAQADDKGELSLNHLPHPARLEAVISAPGLVARNMVLATHLGDKPVTITAVELESAFSIVGHFVDGDGDPVPGVEVWLSGASAPKLSTLTTETGWFSLALPRQGRFRVLAQGAGESPISLTAEVSDEKPRADLGTISLRRIVEFWGVVTSDGGEPLENVAIFLVRGEAVRREASSRRPMGAPPAVSAEDGSFRVVVEIRGTERPVLEFWKEGLLPARHAINETDTAEAILVSLGESRDLAGVVVDSSGEPIEGADVSVSGGRGQSFEGGRSGTIQTDLQGAFRVTSLHSGELEVVVSAAGYATQVRQLHLSDHPSETNIQIELVPEARLRACIVDSQGRPVANVNARYCGPSGQSSVPTWIDTTDATGCLELGSLPSGPTPLCLWHPASDAVHREELFLLPGPQDLELRWPLRK